MFIGLVMTSILTGIAATAALWSYNPVLALLCAPLTASLLTGIAALLRAALQAAAQKYKSTWLQSGVPDALH
jgi:hypothetical protein